jgi:hypothetical protein
MDGHIFSLFQSARDVRQQRGRESGMR